MKVLGVNATSTHIFLATIENGAVIPGLPERLDIPNGVSLNSDLLAMRDEIRRRITQIAPDAMAVLFGEIVRKATHPAWTPRVAAETLVRIVAAEGDIPSEILTRPKVRSLLGLPSKGKLESHVISVLPTTVGSHWSAGRNLAALAALALERRG